MKVTLPGALAILFIGGSLSGVPAARAQSTMSDEVEAVVVTAERAGVPMWRLSRGAGTVVLIGAIGRIPEASPWRPAALEAAIAEADAVILRPQANGSPLDLARLMLNARKIDRLPKGETVASRYGGDIDRRIGRLAAAGRITGDYTRLRARALSVLLLLATDAPGSRKRAPEVEAVAEKAAKRAKTPRRPIMRARLADVVDDLKTDSPNDLECLEAATVAAEEGSAGALRRGQAYAQRRIPDVLDSTIERALSVCASRGSGTVADRVRLAWRTTVEAELGRPGVVVAVAPLQTAAGPNGILDALQAQGVTIAGPRWRRDQTPGQSF